MKEATVIIVEPDCIVARSLEQWLSNHGYSVSAIVSSGDDAIREAESHHPDLILIDTRLKGGKSSVEVARIIRSSLNIPSIQLATFPEELSHEEGDFAEIFGYLIKPFSAKDLHLAVEMTLSHYRMEQKVHESREWLATIVRSICDAVITTDMEGFITSMNPAAERLSGWGFDEVKDKPLEQVLTSVGGIFCFRTCLVLAISSMTMGTANLSRDITLITRSGAEIPIEWNVSLMQDAGGGSIGIVIVFRDATGRRRSELALRSHKGNPEQEYPVGRLLVREEGVIAGTNDGEDKRVPKSGLP